MEHPATVPPQSLCRVDPDSLLHNVREIRRLLSPGVALYAVVKANAYGHGLCEVVKLLSETASVDGYAVDSLWEAGVLRERFGAGLTPIIVLGNVPPHEAQNVARLNVEVTAYDQEFLTALVQAAQKEGTTIPVHLKVETGNNRQGVGPELLLRLARFCQSEPGLRLRGLSTHFADIEDTTDHGFAREQLRRFRAASDLLDCERCRPEQLHCANSAATILWPETHFDVVRLGISGYGMWPSRETYISALATHRERPDLRPALRWDTHVAQVKRLQPGDTVGYGRTYYATHETRIAVLPVGYYDGYDRRLSNQAYVLVRGQRAPVRGRVCMDMTMVDVTDVPDVAPNDTVVLLGEQGEERVTAEQLADWMGSINYEVTTRIAGHIPRVIV